MSAVQTLAVRLPCPRCRAEVGAVCRTKTGRVATYPHAARQEPLMAAWREGYQDGMVGGAWQLAGRADRWPADQCYSGQAVAAWVREYAETWR